MRRRAQLLGLAVLAGVAVVITGVVAGGSPAAPRHRAAPESVTTSSDAGKAKLDDALRQKVDAGQTAQVPVFVTATGDLSQVRALLDDDKTSRGRTDAKLVIGTIGVQATPKLAAIKGVQSVGLIQFKQTGRPLGDPDPTLRRQPTRAQLQARAEANRKGEVPYSRAPKLQGSHFEQLKRLGVMDGKTHNFAEAWRAGFAGEGVTAAVLDGGTDFGHPDLIGTYQTWSGLTDTATTDDGWNGWPKAFDPFGTLELLAAPSRITGGLSWYTPTTAATCGGNRNICRVTFATRTGPSRNFSAPAGTNSHEYKFPREWTKSGTVRLGSHPDDYLLQTYEERPAFLVTDPHTAGVYDTVHVDLDDDHSFEDEKPVTKSSPTVYRDMNGDGLTDISGGLLYYISDGKTRIPGGVQEFGDAGAPAPGALLAWTGDFDPAIEGHGTLTASNVVGQAVINGGAPRFDDLPGDGRVPGAVLGGAPRAKLAPYGDIYFSFEFSTQLGYLLSVEHGVDVTSNSYGNSAVDNDGYDAASQEADIIHAAASDGTTTPVFSSGNGAPGYGTVTGPSPVSGIKVGASTQFGATGWDALSKIREAPDNDVIPWSDRGPAATGSAGIDVVADGAYSSGDKTLNTVGDGDTAWETWGGTSRSTPVAVGATALVYQAYRKAHGGQIPAGFMRTAKRILKSSANDLGYDSFTQGSGSLDAGRAVQAAQGGAPAVSPDEWRVGDYRGDEFPVFTHVIAPGGSDEQTFNLSGPGDWSVSDRYLRRTDVKTFDFTTASQTKESAWSFNSPDYLIDISSLIKAHPGADLMVVKANYPHSQFDGDANYDNDQNWRLFSYRWTDKNHDHKLWVDQDHDGVVDHVNSKHTDIDGDALIDYKRSEIQPEYVRHTYLNNTTNSYTTMVRNPRDRMSDGEFIGLQHQTHGTVDRTDWTIEVSFYENTDWPWLTHSPTTTGGAFSARLAVPANTPYGMYQGAIKLSKSGESIVVPVSVAVAAQATQDADGNITGALQFGGEDVAAAQDDQLYNNGAVFGAGSWDWRAESGDWRFFFYDVGKAPPAGTQFLADTSWDDAAPFTDLDTLIMGRGANTYQLFGGSTPFGGRYILDTVGKSPNTNATAGTWLFKTATGGARDIMTAPAQEGLHSVVQHQVGWQGDKFRVPFTTTVGSATVSPSSVTQAADGDTGSFDVTFESGVALDGLTADAFGLSQAQRTQIQPKQDNPNDPSTASVKQNITLSHASRLTVDTSGVTSADNPDDDLYVVYDANKDGVFSNSEIVASGATGATAEHVELVAPPDGNYQIWVHGFSVSGTPNLNLDVVPIQGDDLTVTGLPGGAVPAGTPVTLHVAYSKAMTSGQDYLGELLLGPPSAPSAFKVPIKIHRN